MVLLICLRILAFVAKGNSESTFSFTSTFPFSDTFPQEPAKSQLFNLIQLKGI